LLFAADSGLCAGMTDEIIRPQQAPAPGQHAMGPLSSFLAATGVALMAVSMLGAASAATVWAASRLMGLPDSIMFVLMAIGALPVIWATIWSAGRAWHVERRLEDGLDIDQPVFRLFYYWGLRKSAAK
jgi:hypothetical protein